MIAAKLYLGWMVFIAIQDTALVALLVFVIVRNGLIHRVRVLMLGVLALMLGAGFDAWYRVVGRIDIISNHREISPVLDGTGALFSVVAHALGLAIAIGVVAWLTATTPPHKH